MNEIRNEELRFIDKWARDEEVVMNENLYHLRKLWEVIKQCDNPLFDSNDADIVIQDVFTKSETCESEEPLQDILSDNIYSKLQDVRDAMLNLEELG